MPIGNTIGNTIGKSIKKKRFPRHAFRRYFDLFKDVYEKRATAILTGRYARSTFVEDQREFVEHFQYGKQIGKILDIRNRQKRHRTPKHILLGLESEKTGDQVPFSEIVEKYIKFAHEISVQNGCDAFPNELMRFRIEAKPIWE